MALPHDQAVTIEDLSAEDRDLLRAAKRISRSAYAPYSGFGVGAASRTEDGRVFVGANMENASYGLTLCAETSVLLQAVAAEDLNIEAIAIVGGPLVDGEAGGGVVTPCGRCRQLILEVAHVAGIDVRVISADYELKQVCVSPISVLLPHGFGPANVVQ